MAKKKCIALSDSDVEIIKDALVAHHIKLKRQAKTAGFKLIEIRNAREMKEIQKIMKKLKSKL